MPWSDPELLPPGLGRFFCIHLCLRMRECCGLKIVLREQQLKPHVSWVSFGASIYKDHIYLENVDQINIYIYLYMHRNNLHLHKDVKADCFKVNWIVF